MKFLVLTIITCIYLFFNIYVVKTMTILEMKEEFIQGQCFIGKLAANTFYTPAWIIKVLTERKIQNVK